jgi:hypothetical protein
MKIAFEFEITPATSGGVPRAIPLDSMKVARRLARRLVNADISVLHLDYEDDKGQPVPFVAEMKICFGNEA